MARTHLGPGPAAPAPHGAFAGASGTGASPEPVDFPVTAGDATPTEEIEAPPAHWGGRRPARDGRTAHIRPIRPEDDELLVEFYARVSDESKRIHRFFPDAGPSERDVRRFTHVDHVDRWR